MESPLRRAPLLLLFLPALMAPDCLQDRFEVVMESMPDGRTRRTVTVWMTGGGESSTPPTATGPAAEDITTAGEQTVTRLEAVYGPGQRAADNRTTFTGVFGQNLPADLFVASYSNSGRVVTLRSALGESRMYVERMPGRTNMLELADSIQKAVDVLFRGLSAYVAKHAPARSTPEQVADV